MRFRDQWRFVRKNAAKNRSRLVMTVLATAIGCAFFIVLASVGFGIQESIVSDITEGRVLNEIAVRGKRDENRFQSIGTADIELMASLPQCSGGDPRTVPRAAARISIGYDRRFVGDDRCCRLSIRRTCRIEAAHGRPPERNDEVVVGYHFVQHLHSVARETLPEEDLQLESLVDATLQIQVRQSFAGEWEEQWFPVRIVGVAEPPAQEWLRDPRIWISEAMLTEIEAFTQTPLGQIIPPEASVNDDEPGVAELREALRARLSSDERAYQNVIVHAQNVEDVIGMSKRLAMRGTPTLPSSRSWSGLTRSLSSYELRWYSSG